MLSGQEGSDVLAPGSGADRVFGDAGNDLIQVVGSEVGVGDVIDGGATNDILRNVGGSALVLSVLTKSTGASIPGYRNVEILDLGGFAAIGTVGADTVDLSGFISIVGAPAAGGLQYAGGAGNDRVVGNAQANFLRGDAGIDTLRGENGNDRLEGGADNDVLIGGLGNDILDGGLGADLYVLEPFFGADQVRMSAGDKIDLLPTMLVQGFGTPVLVVKEFRNNLLIDHGTLVNLSGVWAPTDVV